jgi:hypothetical protein
MKAACFSLCFLPIIVQQWTDVRHVQDHHRCVTMDCTCEQNDRNMLSACVVLYGKADAAVSTPCNCGWFEQPGDSCRQLWMLPEYLEVYLQHVAHADDSLQVYITTLLVPLLLLSVFWEFATVVI